MTGMELAFNLTTSDMADALDAAAAQAQAETLPNYASALRAAADWARLPGDGPDLQKRIAAAFFGSDRARPGR